MQAVYVSSNQFKVSTDKTGEFLAGRRVRAMCGSNYVYSTIVFSIYLSPDTIVTIEEGVLTSNLSAVHYGIVNIGEQGSFPNHSHSGVEGTGGELSLLVLADTPNVYGEGNYLRSTTSGVEWAIPDDRYYTESEVDTISGSLNTKIDGKADTVHSHTESDISDLDKYTEVEVNTISGSLQSNIDGKSDNSHLHDDRYYTESEVDTISGSLQTDIDTKSDVEWFLTDGVPSNSIGKLDDIAVDEEIGDIYEKLYAVTSTTWNPADKQADIILSNGNLTAKNTAGTHSCARTIVKKSSGKWYWEIEVDTCTTYIFIGIGASTTSLDAQLGNDAGSYCYREDGTKRNNNSSVAYGDSYTVNAVIGVALDMDAGKVWFAKNGVWQASGDPVNGTNEAFSGISGDIFGMFSIRWNNQQLTANFGASAFSHTVPAGFTAGLGGGVVEWTEKLSPDFLKLSDTPTTYAGGSGKYLKTTTTGIEFSDDELYTKSEVDTISGSLQTNVDSIPNTWISLDDTPDNYPTTSGTIFPLDYSKRIKLVIDNTNIDSMLSNFPVLIKISNDSGITSADVTSVFTELGSDSNRKKITVTTSDETTQCYVEIERFDYSNSVAWLWVKVPSIFSGAETDLYLYYDSTQPDNTSYVGDTGDTPAQSVWDSDFKLVMHMAQDPSGGSNAIKDSTSNVNHGTPDGNMVTADLVDGLIGKAIDFDGTDDYINCGSDASLDDLTIKTVETTINLDTFGENVNGRIIQKANVNDNGWSVVIQGGTNNRLLFSQAWAAGATWVTDTDTLVVSTWYNTALVYNSGSTGNAPLFYINDASQNITLVESPAGTCDSDAANDLWIGARNNTGPDREYDGRIDEVRISNTVRSADWIKATYHSNWDGLVTFGTEELKAEDDVPKYVILKETMDGVAFADFPTIPEDFLDLSDTPTTYSGESDKYLKTTSSGIEFSTIEISLLDLTDTPDSYIEGNYLRTTASGVTTISGIILTASDDSEWLIRVTTSGILYTTAV